MIFSATFSFLSANGFHFEKVRKFIVWKRVEHFHVISGPGQPQAPFSPPPQNQPQSQVVHVNPNFQGPIPQEAFSYQHQPPRYPPNPQPRPPYPTTSQPGPRPHPQHFQQPSMPPNSVQPHHPPQQFSQPRQVG